MSARGRALHLKGAYQVFVNFNRDSLMEQVHLNDESKLATASHNFALKAFHHASVHLN
jgi:hypothetical protein